MPTQSTNCICLETEKVLLVLECLWLKGGYRRRYLRLSEPLLKVIVGQWVICSLSVYAPQCSLSDDVMDLSYDQLRAMTAMIPALEFLIPYGDWNRLCYLERAHTSFTDVKVIPGEEIALQHQLLLCDMISYMPPQIKRKHTRPKVRKFRDPQICSC